MKTQLFTLILVLVLSINVYAVEKSNASSAPDQIPVGKITSILSTVEEESLSIKEWMTNDAYWQKENELPELDSNVETEDHLTIEPWMTDSKLWEVKNERKSNIYTLEVGGKTYKVFRITNVKEAPLRIEAWMTNDRLWRL